MNEEVFNTSIRKFLKKLGVTAQREGRTISPCGCTASPA
jgi:hypothetical protein